MSRIVPNDIIPTDPLRDKATPMTDAIADYIPIAWRDVVMERERQMDAEGWTLEHDDKHTNGELAAAAGWYALSSLSVGQEECAGLLDPDCEAHSLFNNEHGFYHWPWNLAWFKPTNRRRDLVKATALLLAEIERLDREGARS